MNELLSDGRVKDVLRNNVNLDCLVPQLMKHNLLTRDQFLQLCDRNGTSEPERIDYLITVLARKGGREQVENLITSLEGACEHTGHREILTVVKEVTSSSKRSRERMQDDCESDSTKKPKIRHQAPNLVTNFVGRQDVLQHSIKLLTQDSTQILSIVGMPAVGKSQLAMAIGKHMEQQLNYIVIYHDLLDHSLDTTKLSDGILDVNGCNHCYCLILDNIDTQCTSTMLASIQDILRHYKVKTKFVTTSCKVFRDASDQLDIKRIRVLPYTEEESKLYLSTMLKGDTTQDIEPVIKACAGVPLALRCAVENLKNDSLDVQDFYNDEEILQLLEVESFGLQSLNQVEYRLQNRFSFLTADHQKVLKEIANDSENFEQKLQGLPSKVKRSLYNSGWLEQREDKTFLLNDLLHTFLRGNFRSRAQP